MNTKNTGETHTGTEDNAAQLTYIENILFLSRLEIDQTNIFLYMRDGLINC